VEALNEHADRPVAVSIRAGTKRKNAREEAPYSRAPRRRRLYFFDSVTHPLGKKKLRVEPPWRRLIKPVKIGKAA
jgi:hypothetical protein